MIIVRHEFYERASAYAFPIVVHEFRGKTLHEAVSFFRTHMRYDRMLRGTTFDNHLGNREGVWNGIQFKSVVRVVENN